MVRCSHTPRSLVATSPPAAKQPATGAMQQGVARLNGVLRGRTRYAILHDMSPKGSGRSDSAFTTLTPDQQRSWLAYMREQLRLTYEMNRQLQADSSLSLPDYDVLNALRYAPGGRMRITALAARIGWERSTLPHHVPRLQNRGLVECRPAPADRRATEITLTDQGWDEISRASSEHIDL